MKFFSSIKKQAINFLEPCKEKGPATYAAAEQAIGAILITDGLIGIDNPFGNKKRPGIFGTIGGIIFGIIFMLIPGFIGTMTNIKNMTETAPAVVISVGNMVSSSSNGGGTCGLEVRYTVNGQDYTKQSSMSASNYCSLSAGETILINYDPNTPGSWAYGTKTMNAFLNIFFWVGLLVLISSIFTFFIRLLSIIFGWNLLRDGRKNAANLPKETNLQTMINEIKQNFIASVFGFGGQKNTTVPINIPSLLSSLKK